MQVHTERGLISVEANYQSTERAKMDGYSYAFHSKELSMDVYSKIVEGKINCRTFATIGGYR